jgi:hypothetical protein
MWVFVTLLLERKPKIMAKETSSIHSDSPGDKGTQVGQIKTPMCPENVGRKNTPGTHSYAKAMDLNSPGGKGLKTGSSIQGPGEAGTGGKGTSDKSPTISGSNAKGRW